MVEKNILINYKHNNDSRSHLIANRSIVNKLNALERGKNFFDGQREDGYGGMTDDGSWKPVASDLVLNYNLTNSSSVLQLNCEKGYLLSEIHQLIPKANVLGLETSKYAIDNSNSYFKSRIIKWDGLNIPFENKTFDLIICIGYIYTLNLSGITEILTEINRVSKKSSFINLATYNNAQDLEIFKNWSLLGTTVLKKNEWEKVLSKNNYTGDYWFVDSGHLNLIEEKNM